MVAIVTYNGEEYVKKCIDSIQSKKHEISIEVIDNCSTDNTLTILSMFNKKVSVYQSTKNLGFGKANNILFQKAIKESFDYVFLLNQDAYFIEDSLDIIIDHAVLQNKDHIISPIHLKNEKGSIDDGFQGHLDRAVKDKESGELMTDFVNAAALLVPVNLLNKVGGFASIFFHYGEDNDFGHRVNWHGFSFIICKNSYIVHDRVYKTIDKYYDLNKLVYWNRVRVYFLYTLTNVNKSIPKTSFELLIAFGGLIKKELLKGRFYSILKITESFFSLILNYNSILKHRKHVKSDKPYLNDFFNSKIN